MLLCRQPLFDRACSPHCLQEKVSLAARLFKRRGKLRTALRFGQLDWRKLSWAGKEHILLPSAMQNPRNLPLENEWWWNCYNDGLCNYALYVLCLTWYEQRKRERKSWERLNGSICSELDILYWIVYMSCSLLSSQHKLTHTGEKWKENRSEREAFIFLSLYSLIYYTFSFLRVYKTLLFPWTFHGKKYKRMLENTCSHVVHPVMYTYILFVQ